MEEVKQLTESLIAYMKKLEIVFNKGEKPTHNDHAFFEKVRTEINPIYDMVEAWEEKTSYLIQQRKVDLHPKQVDATVKSIKAIALHSYYLDVRKRRYQDIKKSVEYVLQLLLKELSS